MDEFPVIEPSTQLNKEKSGTTAVLTGEQTQITAKVKDVADMIEGEGDVLVKNIAGYIKSLDTVTNPTGPDFSRTAEQILEENKLNGCNEAGVVFAALLRAKGIPVIYMQVLHKKAVVNFNRKSPDRVGHVFLEADLGDGKHKNIKIINAQTGEITEELPDQWLVGAKGLDSWDIGLKAGAEDLQRMFEEKHQELTTKH